VAIIVTAPLTQNEQWTPSRTGSRACFAPGGALLKCTRPVLKIKRERLALFLWVSGIFAAAML
jgi:hypothetical protein